MTVILGVDLEHEIFPRPDGSFLFMAHLPEAPEELSIGNGWLVFEDYVDVAAVKVALLALQAGADPMTV